MKTARQIFQEVQELGAQIIAEVIAEVYANSQGSKACAKYDYQTGKIFGDTDTRYVTDDSVVVLFEIEQSFATDFLQEFIEDDMRSGVMEGVIGEQL